MSTYVHDAFISYSRRNRDFAARLEKALEDYVPPKDLDVPQRHLDVFRDEADFTGVEYHRSLDSHLQASAKLVVICSPDARKSQYVNDEIRRFAKANGADNILPVLAAGIPNNEARPEQDAEMAFPDALCEALEMPLAANYLHFDSRRDRPDRGAFEGAWYSILANVYGLSRAVIEQRDRKRLARQRRIQRAIVTGVITALGAALVVTLVSRSQAVTQGEIARDNAAKADVARTAADTAAKAERTAKEGEQQQRQRADERSKVALSRQLAAEAAIQTRENRLDLALLLGLEAQSVGVDTLEARSSLLSALESNPRLVTFLRNDGGVNGLAFSPDGRTLAAAGGDHIALWDTVAQKLRGRPLTGHGDAVFAVAFSRDGRQLVSGSRSDKSLLVWDVATARPLGGPLPGQGSAAVQTVAFSPDGKTFATAGGNHTIVIWDAATRQPRGQPFAAHTSNITSLAFSPDGSRIVSGSWDRTVLLWNAATGERLREIGERSSGQVETVAYSPDGRLIASGGGDSAVSLWDAASGERIGSPLRGHAGSVSSIAFSPDGALVASGSIDRTVRLWDVATRSLLDTLPGHASYIEAVAFNRSGTLLASGGGDGTIILWRVQQPHRLGRRIATTSQAIDSIAFSPDGRALVSADCAKAGDRGGCAGQVRRWDVATGRQVVSNATHAGPILNLVFSRDGRSLLSGSAARTADTAVKGVELRTWDAVSLKSIAAPVVVDTPWPRAPEALAFAPGAGRIAAAAGCGPSTCDAGEIVLRLLAGKAPADDPIRGNERYTTEMAFSPDGRVLAATGFSDVVMWDVAGSRPIGPPFAGTRIAFSPDGRLLAVSDGTARTVVFRDATTGEPRGQPLTGLPEVVGRLAFSPDGRLLASAGSNVNDLDRVAIGLWDVAARQPIGDALRGHSKFVRSLAFSPDGRTLASAGEDTLVLWDLNAPSWRAEACRIANRNLTFDEWTKHLGDVPYRPTCPELAVDVPGLLVAGRRLAGEGDVAGGAGVLRRVRELDPGVALNPDVEANKARAQRLTAQAEYLARSGDVARAVDLFGTARRLDPQLAIEPAARAGALAAPGFVAQGQRQVKNGSVTEAIAAFARASELDPAVPISASAWNDLCRFGSLWGHAREVLAACTKAVTLDPENGVHRDSRGMARALSGDFTGAVRDFEAFTAWCANEQTKRIGFEARQNFESDVAERNRWMAALRASRNPLTGDVIATLRKR